MEDVFPEGPGQTPLDQVAVGFVSERRHCEAQDRHSLLFNPCQRPTQ
ncbi:plexin-B3 isoform X1 [Prionailurus iriomotensis]